METKGKVTQLVTTEKGTFTQIQVPNPVYEHFPDTFYIELEERLAPGTEVSILLMPLHSCPRCGAEGLPGDARGVCGTCADDLREEAKAVEAQDVPTT